MRLFFLLPLASIAIAMLPPPLIEDDTHAYQDDFDYLELPVYVSGEENYITLDYSFSLKGYIDRYLYVYVYKYGDYGDNILIYSETFEDPSITREIPIDYEFPSNANEIYLTIKIVQRRETMTNKIFNIPNKHLGSVRIDNNPEYTSTAGAKIYRTGDRYAQEIEERYEFENFFSEYSPTYSYLDISQLRFKYDGPLTQDEDERTLTYKYATFQFDDVDGIFNNIGHFDPPYIHSLSVKLVHKRDGYYYIQWNQKLYVDPLTLEMSNTLKEGFVETPYFYFPRSLDYAPTPIKCMFFFRYLGLNKENFGISFTIDKTTPVVGYCGSSSYCVSSTSGTPNFEIGESVTYK